MLPNNDFETIASYLADTYQFDVFLLDSTKKCFRNFPEKEFFHPLYPTIDFLLERLVTISTDPGFPFIHSLNQFELFGVIQTTDQNGKPSTLILGPVVKMKLKEPQLDNLIQDIGRPKEATLLKEYFQMLPYYDFRVFVQITSFVYYLLTKQQWSVDEIIQKNNRLNIEKNVWQTVHQSMVQQENETNLSHHDPLFEKKFFQTIKEGNLDEIKKYEILHPTYGDFGLLSTDSQLRNQKNIGIVAIALATRAAIEAGLDSETAYSLSDLYIQRLEKMQAIAVVDSLISEAVIDFTQRVHRINCALYSKEIVHAKNYLYSHLYQHFSLESLAKEVALHPNYLSRLFKKEVGKTLSAYLLEEKVKEAKRLIALSDYSLSEISSMLQFYDQSHFSRVFKKYAGFTPIEYKNQQGIKEF